jgi:hypothetical protein
MQPNICTALEIYTYRYSMTAWEASNRRSRKNILLNGWNLKDTFAILSVVHLGAQRQSDTGIASIYSQLWLFLYKNRNLLKKKWLQ